MFEIIRWTRPSHDLSGRKSPSRSSRLPLDAGARRDRRLASPGERGGAHLRAAGPRGSASSASRWAFSRRRRSARCPARPIRRSGSRSPARARSRAHIEKAQPDFIHIATEGPIGLMTRRYCRKRKWPFTTSYHTRFPECVSARLPVPEGWCYALQRRFHNGAAGTFVATQSIEDELDARGFERLMRWSRGVDTDLFRPRRVRRFGKSRCSSMSAASRWRRTSRPFSISTFPAARCWSASGPQRLSSRGSIRMRCSPGRRRGEDLARAYASADVFVFPSLTDTFGLVLARGACLGSFRWRPFLSAGRRTC